MQHVIYAAIKIGELSSSIYINKNSPTQCFDWDACTERLRLFKKYNADQEGTQKLCI